MVSKKTGDWQPKYQQFAAIDYCLLIEQTLSNSFSWSLVIK